MKTSLKIFARFLAACAFGTGIIALVIFTVSVGRIGAGIVNEESRLWLHMLHAFSLSLLPGWILGVLLTLFSALHALHKSPLPLLPVAVGAAGVLFLFLSLSIPLYQRVRDENVHIRLRPMPGNVYQTGEQTLIFGKVQGISIGDILYRSKGNASPSWRYISEGIIDPLQNEILLSGQDQFDLDAVKTARWALFSTPSVLSGLQRDLNGVVTYLLQAEVWVRAILSVLLSVVFFSLWTLVRLTRWPLLNAMLLFTCVRILLFLAGFLVVPETQTYIEVVLGRTEIWVVPVIFLSFLATVLIGWGMLLSPFATWSEEVKR